MKVHYTNKYLIDPQHPVTINVIGCGGNGSQMLMQLARINEALKKLGHLGLHVTCFDDDIVTPANLGRQLFSEAELGLNKAVAMITRINRFFGTQWTAEPTRFDNDKYHSLSQSANIMISCVDSIAARKNINKYIEREKRGCSHPDPYMNTYYWMDLGNTQAAGQFIIGTIKTGSTPKSKKKDEEIIDYMPTVFEKFPDMAKQKEKKSGPSCSLAEALEKQDLFVNSILVQFAAQTLWRMFREGKIIYQGAFINLQTLKIATINL
jgi:PRTRC genetic system ThiF family protein